MGLAALLSGAIGVLGVPAALTIGLLCSGLAIVVASVALRHMRRGAEGSRLAALTGLGMGLLGVVTPVAVILLLISAPKGG